MKRDELLYLKLIEECAEVQHRVCKLMQYGGNERQENAPAHLNSLPEVPPGTNQERLEAEVRDLLSILHMLGFKQPTAEQIEAKRQRVYKYMDYSISLGKVD